LDPIIGHAIPRSRSYPPVDLNELFRGTAEIRAGFRQMHQAFGDMRKFFNARHLCRSAYASYPYTGEMMDFLAELARNRRFIALEKLLWRHLHLRFAHDFTTNDGDADLVYLYLASQCRSLGEERETLPEAKPARCSSGSVSQESPICTSLGSGHLSTASIERKGAKNAAQKVVDRNSFSHYVQRCLGEVDRKIHLTPLGTIYLRIYGETGGKGT
jgi:hypothetical protein